MKIQTTIIIETTDETFMDFPNRNTTPRAVIKYIKSHLRGDLLNICIPADLELIKIESQEIQE